MRRRTTFIRRALGLAVFTLALASGGPFVSWTMAANESTAVDSLKLNEAPVAPLINSDSRMELRTDLPTLDIEPDLKTDASIDAPTVQNSAENIQGPPVTPAATRTSALKAVVAKVRQAVQKAGNLSHAPDSSVKKLGSTLEGLLSAHAADAEGKGVKVALCQIDTTVGDFDYNVRHMLRFIQKSAEAGADIAVFPELSLSGYPPRDLLEYPQFVETNAKALQALVKGIRQIPNAPKTVVIGSVVSNPRPVGRPLQNAAVVIHEGQVVHAQAKRLLPNYDVFDDMRYFEPATRTRLWSSPWGKIGLSICEDAWHAALNWGRRIYKTADPAESLKSSDLAFNLSASPYELGKHARRKDVISNFAKRIAAPFIYVNQVGPQDDILFDGGSLVLSPKGEILLELPQFKEALGIVALKLGRDAVAVPGRQWEWSPQSAVWTELAPGPAAGEMEILHRALVSGIRGYFTKVGHKKAVIGLSGGIDSSVVASLAAAALGPENVLGVLMPSKYSSSGSVTDAKALAANLGIQAITVPIQEAVDSVGTSVLPGISDVAAVHAKRRPEDDTTEDNIQARLRGVILMALANKFNLLTLNTSNKSEMAVGQCTTYGDMAGALAPIADLFKTKVYELARFINSKNAVIPDAVLSKAPSAELAPGQTDEAKFGPFSTLDPVLEMYLEKRLTEAQIVAAGFDAAYVKKTLAIVQNNEFKRKQSALVLKVTPKAFGSGRRIPVAGFMRPVRENP